MDEHENYRNFILFLASHQFGFSLLFDCDRREGAIANGNSEVCRLRISVPNWIKFTRDTGPRNLLHCITGV